MKTSRKSWSFAAGAAATALCGVGFGAAARADVARTATSVLVSLQQNINWPGNDFAAFRVRDTGACQSACAGTWLCRVFAFDMSNGLCWLKVAASKAVADRRYVSGVLPPSAPSIGEKTTTNRWGAQVRWRVLCSAPAVYYLERQMDTPDECQRACADDYGCAGYDWSPVTRRCGLKKALVGATSSCTAGDVLEKPMPTGEVLCEYKASLAVQDCMQRYTGNPPMLGQCPGMGVQVRDQCRAALKP